MTTMTHGCYLLVVFSQAVTEAAEWQLDGLMLVATISHHSDMMQQPKACLRHKLSSATDRLGNDADKSFADA